MHITVLHPGAMGSAIAASIQRAGHDVHVVPFGRSKATQDRANALGLQPFETLETACRSSDIIISVCPPHAAEETAFSVAKCDFKGIYVDANAISPGRTRRLQDILEGAGATYVDGGIVGGPPKERNQTYLYLSGPAEAQQVADCFQEGLVEAKVISNTVGDASALKMCYAAYTKGSTALLIAITAAAENLGVRDVLFQQWKDEGSELDETAIRRTRFVTKKAWRWVDEMEEISRTFEGAGQPGGFHKAAAEVYRRIEHLKHNGEPPEFMEVLTSIMRSNPDND